MNNQTLTRLANQIVALRNAPSPIPQPLTYKSGGNTSAMIALFLPTSTGTRFIQSDSKALPLNELHITLAYLGKVADLSLRQVKKSHDLMRLISENHPPLTGHINGCGRFCNGDDDGDPFFIIPDLSALPNLRELIVMWLKGNDIEVASDHGFVPHITLTYLPHAERNPFDILERTPISFRAISLVLGDDRYDYPLAQGGGLLSKAALIEKIGARHAHHEIFQIQHIHDLTLGLGAECHPLTRRAGARHSNADQTLVQRIHDDCAGLGAECKALPERDPVYSSQTLKEGPGAEVTKHLPGKHRQKAHGGGKGAGGTTGKKGTKKPSVASITSGLPKNLGFLEKKERTAISKQLAELSTDELTKAISANNKKLDNPKLIDPDRDLATDLKLRNTLIMSNMLEDAAKRKVKKLKREQEKIGKGDYVIQGVGIITDTPTQRLDIIKAQSDAPNYKAASTPQRCKNCRFFLGDPGRDWCDLFDFTADQDFVCDSWEAQRPDEIPGYVANKGDLIQRNWENSTPAQRKGRDAVNNAIKVGILKKASTKICFRCHKRPGAEYHHVDGYAEGKVLNVRAVCFQCHSVLTRKADLATLTEEILTLRGGATSGNWGHAGRKGKRGGSGGGGGFGRIGVKPGSKPSRKKVTAAAKKKQAKAKPTTKKKKPAAKPKPKVTTKKPAEAKAKPKVQAKPVPAKKPTTKQPNAKLKEANANLATAKEKRDIELKSIVDLERRQTKANANLRNKKDVLGALNTLDDVEAKLKGRSSKKIMDQYNKDTKADSEIVFAANLKEAKVARSQMKNQLQANTKTKAEAKKEVKQAETKALKAQNKFFESKKQFGTDDPRTGKATDTMLSSLDDFKAAKANLSKVDTQSKNQMLDVLKVSNPASTKIAADSSKTTKAKRKEWQDTMNDVNKLVSADVTTPGHEVKFTTQGKKVRAHALPPGDEIIIKTNQQSRVIAHEIAHTIEMKNPRILQRAEEWRDNRTKGEREQLLSKVTGNKNYKKDEKTKPDKFISPYIGKPYKNATEVISMGLDKMFDDPVKFAKDDADMFDFIYAVLRSG